MPVLPESLGRVVFGNFSTLRQMFLPFSLPCTLVELHVFLSFYSMLADKLNMSPEEAERWIVNLIRNARLDAKIDSKLVRPSHVLAHQTAMHLISQFNFFSTSPLLSESGVVIALVFWDVLGGIKPHLCLQFAIKSTLSEHGFYILQPYYGTLLKVPCWMCMFWHTHQYSVISKPLPSPTE